MKFRVSNLPKSVLTAAIDEANLTTLQKKIVAELNSEELNDLGIMYKFNIGHEKYYAEKANRAKENSGRARSNYSKKPIKTQ